MMLVRKCCPNFRVSCSCGVSVLSEHAMSSEEPRLAGTLFSAFAKARVARLPRKRSQVAESVERKAKLAAQLIRKNTPTLR